MHALFSPFIVPLGAFMVAIVAIVSGIYSEAHKQRLRAEQRMAMVGRGMSADEIDKVLGKGKEEEPVRDPLRSLGNARRAGIVLIACGVGLTSFFLLMTWILHVREVLVGAAAGSNPLAIGVGFLIDYSMQKRELSRFGLEAGTELPNAKF